MPISLIGELNWGSQDVTGPGQRTRLKAESQPQLGCPAASVRDWCLRSALARERVRGQRGPPAPLVGSPPPASYPHG